MDGIWLLDLLLVVLLAGYLFYGFRSGLVRSVGALAGIVVGVIAAFFAVPLVGASVPIPVLRLWAVLAAAVVLVLLGHALGVAIGGAIRGQVRRTPLGTVDRLLGAAVNAVAAALIVSLLAFNVVALGVPALSPLIASSAVLRTINTLTPDPVEAFLAQLRSTVIEQGIPRISEAIGGITESPEPPDVDPDNPALVAAAQSAVRIRGNAYDCGQNQSGSGFVVATDRIVTNAHVVAGVAEPIVESPAGQSLTGRIVYFDPVDDLAVIAVSGLTAAPLQLADTLAVGSLAVAFGYPYGGPFQSSPAEVLSVDTATIPDIYGGRGAPREVYTLAAGVEQGDSGGPLVAESGAVAGVVFATSASTANVGYAMTIAELAPVAAQAPSLSTAVASGACIRG